VISDEGLLGLWMTDLKEKKRKQTNGVIILLFTSRALSAHFSIANDF